jgi:hypothetical protein
MKEIPVPAAVVLYEQVTGQPSNQYTFKHFALVHWLNDKRWLTPLTNLDAMLRIKKEIEKDHGETMFFQEGDLKILAEVINAPTVERDPPLAYFQVRQWDQMILDLAAQK